MGNTQSVKCDNCGSTNMTLQGDYFVCTFCNTAVHKSQFKQKSNKQSKYEAEYEHSMKRAEAYERQDNIDSAKYEYMTLVQKYPYRYEGYTKLLPLLISEYKDLKEAYTLESVMTIKGIEVTKHIHTKYAVGDLGNSGKITMRESANETEAQNGQLFSDFVDLEKLLDCIEAYYDDMQGLTNKDKANCSALMSELETFIEDERDGLEDLDETLQERHQCEILLQEKYCYLYNIYTMYESTKTYKYDGKSRDEFTAGLSSANSTLSAKKMFTAGVAIGGTLLAILLSRSCEKEHMGEVYTKGLYTQSQFNRGAFSFFVMLMIPVIYLIYKMVQQVKKSKLNVQYCQESIGRIDKMMTDKGSSITRWRKEVDRIDEELKNSRFTLPTDIFGQN